MSITDELREWAEDNTLQDTVLTTYPPQHAVHGVLETLLRIADRIDAEHERAMYDMRREHDEWVADRDAKWVTMPLDADGEPIHVGDVMEWPDGETFDVIGIGDGVLFYTESECDGPAEWTGASTKRHHHAPTVEDVLTEFALAVCKDDALTIRKGVVEEYAKRLRLAKEDA